MHWSIFLLHWSIFILFFKIDSYYHIFDSSSFDVTIWFVFTIQISLFFIHHAAMIPFGLSLQSRSETFLKSFLQRIQGPSEYQYEFTQLECLRCVKDFFIRLTCCIRISINFHPFFKIDGYCHIFDSSLFNITIWFVPTIQFSNFLHYLVCLYNPI
jgi:hypothetical protein